MTLQRLLLVLVTCSVALHLGCKQEPPSPSASASAALEPMKLPPLVVKDTSQNLLFTWVDEQGDFHVVQKTQEVPEGSRKRVRVVDTRRSEGTQEWVYVADLTQKKPDGSYAMSALPRGKWDEIGAKRRKVRLEALAPSAAPAPPAANGSDPPPANAQLGVNLSAIVYGADWCKPCHAAEAYLKKRGVKVTMKDIDNSDAARAEMQHKLTRAGMGGAQIPIIDMMGQLLVGYSPSALDRAIQTARQSKTL